MGNCPSCGTFYQAGRFCGKCGGFLPEKQKPIKPEPEIFSFTKKKREPVSSSNQNFSTVDVDKLSQEIKKNPTNPAGYLSLAEALLKIGKIDRALSTFRALRAIAPDNVEVFRLGARIYESLGRKDDAILALQSCLRIDGRDIDAALQTARLLFETGRKKKALEILERLKVLGKSHPEILLNMAEIRLSLGDPSGAQESVAIYKTHSGKTLKMYILLGKSMLLQNFFDGAIKTFSEGLVHFPQDSELLMGLGKALLKNGEKGQALLEFERACQFSPDNVEILLELGQLYGKMGLEEKMHQTFQKIDTNEINNGEVFLVLAKFFYQRGQIEETVENLEKARHLSPHHFEIVRLYGKILEEKGNFAQALSEYETFVQGSPKELWALEGIIRSATELKDFAKVIRAQEKVIEAGHKTPDTWCDLGETLIRLGKYDDATIAFEEASKIDPTCVRAYQAPELIKVEKSRSEGEKLVVEAKAAIKKKFWLTASEKLERALHHVPRETSWMRLLAEVNLKTGSIEQASELLSKVRAATPGDFWVSYNLARTYEYEDKLQLAIELLSSILKDHPLEIQAHLMLFRLKKSFSRGQRLDKEMLEAMAKNVHSEFSRIPEKWQKILEAFTYYTFGFDNKIHGDSLAKAETLFLEILSEFSDSIWAHRGMSLICRTRGEVKKAAAYLQEVIKHSADPEALISLARLYENFQQFSEAEKIYQSLSNLLPENAYFRKKVVEMIALGTDAGSQEGLPSFLSSRQNDLRRDPQQAWTLFDIGWAQVYIARKAANREEHYKKALLTWNKAVTLENVPPWMHWGKMEAQLEFFRGAERVRALNQQLKNCERLVREHPDMPFSHAFLGKCYLGFEDLAQTDRAVKHLETTSFLAPENPELLYLLGQTYRSVGKSSRVDLVRNNMIILEPETSVKL